MSDTLTINSYLRKKPIKVRLAPVKARRAKPTPFRLFVRKAVVTSLSAIIVLASYFITFQAGVLSTFTEKDWDALGHMGVVEISKVIPLPGVQYNEYYKKDYNPIVMVSGKDMSKGEFCATQEPSAMSPDVAYLCL